MALRTWYPNSTRCIAIALGVMALSALLQWLSALVWAEPARTQLVLESLYLGRGAVLRALHVMALALLTTGLLQAHLPASSTVCAGWAACGSLIETTQHPVVVDRLLRWTHTSPLPQQALDATLGLILNSRFAWSEFAASLVGGAAAWAIIRCEARRRGR
jgi:hypothetical protein